MLLHSPALVKPRTGNIEPEASLITFGVLPVDPHRLLGAEAGLLALACFIALVVVPGLKYPPNPPAVGDGATIGYRTGLYFLMLAISIAAAVSMIVMGQRLARRHGAWNAVIAGGVGYVVIILVALGIQMLLTVFGVHLSKGTL